MHLPLALGAAIEVQALSKALKENLARLLIICGKN